MKKVHFRITLAMTILLVILMILSALVIALPGMQGREYGMNPAATASANIQPDPTLNTNITWSSFYHGWNPLEYSNGSANLTLNTGMSSIYANPISVNPTDLVASGALQSDKLGSYGNWTNLSLYQTGADNASFPATLTTSTLGTQTTLTLTVKASGTGNNAYSNIFIPVADFPSGNPAYDYLTIAYSLKGPSQTGVNAAIQVTNSTASSHNIMLVTPGESGYISAPLTTWQKYDTFNTTGSGTTSNLQISLLISMLNGATENDQYTLTVSGMAFTDYLMSLGTNSTGTTLNQSIDSIHLSTFSPSFNWQSILNDGYSVAVSQPLQNLTTQQSAVNTLNYIEQVEYQGQFNLPTAPDLSYGAANLTEHFNVNTSQTQVLDINGVSYLSTISGKNGTIQLLASVDPNGQTQFLQIVDYTQSQWTSISSPPGIFTLPGLEYYWEEFIIAILAIVGVGAGAASRHASNLRKVK